MTKNRKNDTSVHFVFRGNAKYSTTPVGTPNEVTMTRESNRQTMKADGHIPVYFLK